MNSPGSLQAFIDDSASDSGDQRLFLAGYLNLASRWKLFSAAWQEELSNKPTIKYLKMSEANALDGQFNGWSIATRDEKLNGLARVINHFQPLSFHFSVSREQYYRILKPVSPRGLGNPHFTCCFGIVSMLARHIADQGVRVPIEFIFDEQSGVSDDMALFFDYMKNNIPKRARQLILRSPAFRDDKVFLPIQAADMLAWHVRREHENGGSMGSLPMASHLRSPEGHLFSAIEEKNIRSWAEQFSELPSMNELRGPKQWRNLKVEITNLLAQGYIPPHGTKWKNARHQMQELLSRLFNRS